MPEPINEELRRIVEHKWAWWVRDRIPSLPEKARSRAGNAVRSLYWAGGIATLEDTKYREGERGYRVPATFLLTHAREEAVAALVQSAHASGYGRLARGVNITDHYHKTTLAWLCGEVVNMLVERNLQVAFHDESDQLALCVEQNGQKVQKIATLGLLNYRAQEGTPLSSLVTDVIARHGGQEAVVAIVKKGGQLRNELMYATDTGYQTGPADIEVNLREMARQTMGILWAAVDIAAHKYQRAEIVEAVFRTTAQLKKLAFPPDATCKSETK